MRAILLWIIQAKSASPDDGAMAGGVLLFLALLIACGWAMHLLRKHRVKQTKRDYETSLDMLKASPTNPHFKQEALRLGRRYLDFARKSHGKGGIAIFLFKRHQRGVCGRCRAGLLVACGEVAGRAPCCAPRPLVKGMIEGAEYQFRRQQILGEV